MTKLTATVKKTLVIGMSVLALQAISLLAAANAQESLMAALDKDLDGLISLKEAASHAKLLEMFNEIDTNEDGYISMSELIESDLTDDLN